MSLRARVIVSTVVIAVLLALTAFLTTRTMESNLIQQVDDQLASASTGQLRSTDFGDWRDGDGREGPRLSSLYIGYLTADGVETLAATNLTGDAAPAPELDVTTALHLAAAGGTITTAGGSDLRYRVRAAVDKHTGAVVVLALPLDSVDAAMRRLVTLELAATLLVLAVLGALTWWMVHLGVRPLKRMTSVAAAIADGDLSQRVPDVDPRTEAGELAAALNHMLTEIESSFDERDRSQERLHQFVADASHELRTPIATIRGYAELYRLGGLDTDDALPDAMRRTEQEAVRMAALVDDLLHLARLDQGRPSERTTVDITALAEDAVADARAVAHRRPIDAAVGAPTTVLGDEGQLRQVLANVVGNALVHTGPDVPIHVRVGEHDGRAVVEIADEGAGMDDRTAGRAFERFFRADPSRSRHRGGSGLGLSIVKVIVDAHEGGVSLASRPGTGTTVRIELPLAPAPAAC